jgi:hypothetical protein
MESDPQGFAKYARDLRALGPWAPLLGVAIVFLVIGSDITSGHASDPLILGQGYLALFALALAATLVVRGRHRPMGYVCFGLAFLEGVFVAVSWLEGYLSLTGPMLFITGLTLGGLYAAARLFRGAPSGRPAPPTA